MNVLNICKNVRLENTTVCRKIFFEKFSSNFFDWESDWSEYCIRVILARTKFKNIFTTKYNAKNQCSARLQKHIWTWGLAKFFEYACGHWKYSNYLWHPLNLGSWCFACKLHIQSRSPHLNIVTAKPQKKLKHYPTKPY